MQLQKSNTPSKQRILDYYYVTKPNVISLLVFTGAASYVASAGWKTNFLLLVAVSVSVWLGSAAANTVGSFFDRDIDGIMGRTKTRPIPTGRIAPRDAAGYGILLLALSLGLSYFFLSPLSSLAMLVGFLDYTVVYSYFLKRKSWLNIILGGFSGVMPVLVGYFAASNPVIGLPAILFMGFLVFFWIPEHIWSLAIRFRSEYEEAHVPMLPVVISEKRAVQAIAVTTILMVGYSLLPLIYGQLDLHYVYLGFAAVLDSIILAASLWLLSNPSASRAWTVFKISSPYLFFAFIGIVADILVFAK